MRRSVKYLAGSAGIAVATVVVLISASNAAVQQSVVTNAVPSTATPNIQDGSPYAITRVGTRMIVGGNFTTVENRGSTTVLSRPNILAFDATTGTVDTAFLPTINGQVNALLPGPTADTVYVGGKFTTVDGATHHDLVELNTTTGTVVSTFKPASLNGAVNTLAVSGSKLYVGGTFTTAASVAHAGLATVNATTGTLDPYMTVQLTGHHNYNGTSGADAAVGATQMKITPDGTKMIVIGNFKTANGTDHDQAVMLSLGTTVTLANWETDTLKAACSTASFDSWVRDVDFSPDGSYFVIDGTGGPHKGQACDSAMRFETSATGTGITPTWIDYTGGDTFLSVAITGSTVYVGGHFRWLNNSTGSDSSGEGAVGRPGLAALDPTTGLPIAWNPGRNPRGAGAAVIYADSDGIYVGSDTQYIGNHLYLRGEIAFFPVSGGYTAPAEKTAALPAHIYSEGAQVGIPDTLYRVNVGGPAVASTDSGPGWNADNATDTLRNVDGAVVTYGKNVPKTSPSLPAGTPLALFNDERDYSTTAAPAYTFQVPTGVQVQVNVYIAQRGWDSTNSVPVAHTFSVQVNGATVDADLDPNATIGYNTAGMRSYTVTSTGAVTVGFTESVNTAQVDAIEIKRVGGTSTTTGFGTTSFDGSTFTAGTGVAAADNTPWSTMHGAFMVDNNVYYGLAGNLYTRTFDGTNFGVPSVVDPYNSPIWDGVATGSGTTVYTGVKSNFYAEIPNVQSMFFLKGKLYYTIKGNNGLFWRWFAEDSGIVGADEFTVTGATGFSTASGVLFISDSNLYYSQTNGNLSKIGWTGTTTSGTAAVVSGPGVDGTNWANTGTFLGP